jgi:hypothetical protein
VGGQRGWSDLGVTTPCVADTVCHHPATVCTIACKPQSLRRLALPHTTCHMSMSLDGFVMGRNMFGPIRGDWDEEWTGWWGPEPRYHAPVFVLTHHGPLA